MDASPYRQVSAAPTLPGGAHAAGHAGEFDVAALYEGPLAALRHGVRRRAEVRVADLAGDSKPQRYSSDMPSAAIG